MYLFIFPLNQWTQYQMIMIGQELVTEKLDLMKLQPLVQNPLKGSKVFFFVEVLLVAACC